MLKRQVLKQFLSLCISMVRLPMDVFFPQSDRLVLCNSPVRVLEKIQRDRQPKVRCTTAGQNYRNTSVSKEKYQKLNYCCGRQFNLF